MEVVPLSPLRVAPLFWQPRPGVHSLAVVCKATFELAPGTLRLADVQDYPNEEDNHWNDDESRSLYAASDLVPFKPRAEVLLVGDAFAPNSQPAPSTTVRLIVGAVDKSIEVHGDRFFSQQGELKGGEPIARMPLRWERAAGGRNTANPVGVERNAEADRYGRRPLPNLQPPGLHVKDPSDVIEPVCFAPLAPHWPARRSLLGRHASSWSGADWHERPLPADIDGAFFNVAPMDQRLAELRPDERIVLENLHPTEPRLACQLPGLTPRAFVERAGAARPLVLTADTLWIDTVRSVCAVTWRGRVEISGPAEEGRVLVAFEEPGKSLGWPELSKMAVQMAANGAKEGAGKGSGISPPSRKHNPTVAMSVGDLVEEGTAVGFIPPEVIRGALPFVAGQQPPSPEPPTSVRPAEPPKRRPSSKTSGNPVVSPQDKSPAWLSRSMAQEPGEQPTAPSSRGPALPVPAPAGSSPGVAVPPPPPAASPAEPPSPDASVASSPWAGGKSMPASPVSPAGGSSPGVAPVTASSPPPASPPPAALPIVTPQPGSPPLSPTPGVLGKPAAVDLPAAAMDDSSPAVRSSPSVARIPGSNEIVELLWFNPESMDKIRARDEWRELVVDIHPPPPETDPLDFDAEPPPEESQEVRDRREIVAIMTRARSTNAAELPRVMLDAVDDTGSFEPPVVVVTGKLSFPFDELETLRATVTAATPIAAGDKKLQEVIDTVNEALETPWLQSSSEVAEGMTEKIREAFKGANRMVSADHLDDHVERILLEKRHYQKRMVFGEEWIRALMAGSSLRDQIPSYVPSALEKELPMFGSFQARILCEAHVQQEQYESHEVALKVVALGRVITFSRAAMH